MVDGTGCSSPVLDATLLLKRWELDLRRDPTDPDYQLRGKTAPESKQKNKVHADKKEPEKQEQRGRQEKRPQKKDERRGKEDRNPKKEKSPPRKPVKKEPPRDPEHPQDDERPGNPEELTTSCNGSEGQAEAGRAGYKEEGGT